MSAFRKTLLATGIADTSENASDKCIHTGRPWKKQRLVFLLKNVAYKGDYLTNRSYVVYTDRRRMIRNKGEHDQYYLEGHHEPIVSAEQFERVQNIMKDGLLDSRRRQDTAN